MNRLKLAVFLSSVVLAGSVFADVIIKHPNLQAAYQNCDNALQHLELAQKANRGKLGGHAEKAKHLIEEAQREIEMADHAHK